MRLGLGPRGRRWLVALSGTVACGVAVAVSNPRGARDVTDSWTALVEAADHGAAVDLPRGRGGARLTARQAYLLAFHEAQDAGDLEHVLAVADRLAAAGELDLAAHVRRAADSLLENVEGWRPAPAGSQ
jgi:hypothetical protein